MFLFPKRRTGFQIIHKEGRGIKRLFSMGGQRCHHHNRLAHRQSPIPMNDKAGGQVPPRYGLGFKGLQSFQTHRVKTFQFQRDKRVFRGVIADKPRETRHSPDGRIRNIPNILTILRLIAAPVMALLFLYLLRPLADWFALILFLAAALTDFIDGYLARRWNQTSKLGTMMDPIADKIMVILALMVIVAISPAPDSTILLPATVIVFREVFISGLREFLGDEARLLAVTRLAKWKTTLQMLAIVVLFSEGVFAHYYVTDFGAPAHYIGRVLLAIAALITFISGVDYFIKARGFLQEGKR